MIHPINGRTQLHLYPFFMEPFYSYSRTDYRMSQLNEVNSNGRYYTSGVACVPSFPTYRSCVLLHIASTESQVIESPKRRRSPSIYRVYTTLLLQSTGTASSYKRLQRERSHERLMWDVGVKWRNYIYVTWEPTYPNKRDETLMEDDHESSVNCFEPTRRFLLLDDSEEMQKSGIRVTISAKKGQLMYDVRW